MGKNRCLIDKLAANTDVDYYDRTEHFLVRGENIDNDVKRGAVIGACGRSRVTKMLNKL